MDERGEACSIDAAKDELVDIDDAELLSGDADDDEYGIEMEECSLVSRRTR